MSEAAKPLPPPDGDQNRAGTLIGVFCAMTSLSIALVAARLYTRMRLLRSPGWDDFVLVISVFLVVMNLVILSYDTVNGLGRHQYYLTLYEIQQTLKWEFISNPFGILGVAVPKLAVVIFIQKVMGTAKRKTMWALYFLVITNIILHGIAAILLFAQCNPPYAAWTTGPHVCWDPHIVAYFAYFCGAYSAFIDVVLAAYPITIITKLQISMKRKAVICATMGMGLFAFICAVVRTLKLASLESKTDYTWTSAETCIWTAAEMNTVIICACIPALLPLVQQLSGRKDYLSRPVYQKYPTGDENSRVPLNKRGVALRTLKTHGASSATSREDVEAMPNAEGKTSTTGDRQWNAV